MRIRKLAAVSLSVFLGTASLTAAHAAMLEASINVTGLTFRLIDLAPDDGVAPSLVLQSNYLGLSNGLGDAQIVREWHDGGVFSTQSWQLSSDNGLVQASYAPGSISGSVSVNPADVVNVGNSFSAEVVHGFGADPYAEWTPSDWAFTLSANTALVIEADVSTQYSIDHAAFQNSAEAQTLAEAEQGMQVTLGDHASMSIWINADGWGSSDPLNAPEDFLAQYARDSQYGEYSNAIVLGSGEGLNSRSGSLVAGIANGTDADTQLRFLFSASVGAVFETFSKNPVTEVPVIPEPSTWALMGLGLVGVAAATRRRARTASC